MRDWHLNWFLEAQTTGQYLNVHQFKRIPTLTPESDTDMWTWLPCPLSSPDSFSPRLTPSLLSWLLLLSPGRAGSWLGRWSSTATRARSWAGRSSRRRKPPRSLPRPRRSTLCSTGAVQCKLTSDKRYTHWGVVCVNRAEELPPATSGTRAYQCVVSWKWSLARSTCGQWILESISRCGGEERSFCCGLSCSVSALLALC